MSGDVQPRKRKDKKRKREEESVPFSFYPKEQTEDVNIHVHKEEGTGGGICAKIVFFILFSALIVLIGLIITEHRGLTDLDVAETESRYSQIFEGWVDNEKQDDHHSLEDHHTLDDHDNEHFDDEEDEKDDGHTLDDHDNEHIDDEPSEEEHEHTLDDHDNEHFDDDDQSSPLSEEDEQTSPEEPPQRKYKSTLKTVRYRYRREVSEEDEDENVTESQQDQEDETEEEDIMADSETREDVEEAPGSEEEEDTATDSQQYLEDDEEEMIADSDDKEETEEIQGDSENDNEDQIVSEEEDNKSKVVESEEELKGADLEEPLDDGEDLEYPTADTPEHEEEPPMEEEIRGKASHEQQDDKHEEEEKEKVVEDQIEEDKKPEISEDAPENSGVSDNLGKLSSRTTSSDQESDSEKFSDDNTDYEYSSITNKDDWLIHKDLDEAQKKLPDNAAKALKMFEKILEKYPSSPRGLYGLARALDAFAEMKRSNELLEEAVANYLKLSDLKNVPDDLYKVAMERCIDRLRFRGSYGKAVTVHLKMIKRFPNDPKYRNQLVVTYLTIGRVEQARLVLEETLQKWPTDGCALVHYGFIWKTTDNDLKKGVHYMQKGIETKDPCVIDGRFYFHLGDALFRLGYKDEAHKLYEDGVQHKLFLSKYQRSLYNVNHLTARPWWTEDQLLRYKLLFQDLVKHWQVIRDEGLSAMNKKGYFQDESENLRNTGDWKQFELFARGRKHTKNCNKTPVTCKIIESHPDASGCRRGQTKFSVMHPGTHVWAHCGPTNCRLRVHLGLKVPTQTFIRVGDEIRSWEEGKLLIFDDSFEHEVWHNGTETRLVLIVDVWHPELSMTERETLSSL